MGVFAEMDGYKNLVHDSGVRDVDGVQNAKVSTYGKIAAASGYPFITRQWRVC